jgi:adenylate kinase family enzyme
MMTSDMQRIAVIGTSCSGKSTFARQLGEALGIPHVEMDTLYWMPGWKMRPISDFRDRIAEVVARERWILDGNYGRVRDLVLPRATHVVWLNYPFLTVFWRALTRTVRRAITHERVCGDNRESFRASFLHKDGIPWWVVRTHGSRKSRYHELLSGGEFPHLGVIELKNQEEADRLLRDLRSQIGGEE